MTTVDIPYPPAWFAYQLKMAGLDLREIAHRLDYVSPAACALDIKRHMAEEAAHKSAEDRESMLNLELDRLNYMLSKIWPQIEHGDLKAVDTAIRLINTSCRLMGLDQVDASTHVQTVLVVGGAEDDYIKKLKQAAGEIES